MIKKISTQIHINAPPDRVWQILADTENYPSWNPFIRKISGEQVPGKLIKLSIAISPGAVFSLYARLNMFEHGKTISWTSPFSMPGIFNIEHFFRISPDGGSSAVFIH